MSCDIYSFQHVLAFCDQVWVVLAILAQVWVVLANGQKFLAGGLAMQRGARGTWIEINHLQQYTETQLVHYILVLTQHLARKFHLRAPHLAWVSPDPPSSRFSTVTIFAFGCLCGSSTTICVILYILFG